MNVTKLHWKRLVSNLLVLVMLFSAMPAAAFAEDAQDTTETDLSVVQETTVPEPTAEPTPEPTAAPTDWAAKAAAVKLTGNWRNDLVAIAQTQLGYTEENGVSLYGEWNGTPEADWTALFINWVATQAGLSEKDFPHGDTYKYLRIVMNDKGALIRSSRYAYPSVGDLAMIEVDDKKLAGIITYIDNGYASVIHGDDNGAVTSGTYKISTSEFDFYVNLDVLMEKAGVDTGKGGQVPALPEDGVVAWTSANAVYVREEPTTASQRLATVKKSGTVLTVTSAQMADDGYIWYGIVYEGVVGYIRGDLLTLDKQALPPITPTPEPTPEPTPVPTEAPVVEATEVPVVEETAVPATLADVQALFEAAVADYYREFDGERWVLFETMLALMTADELLACYDELGTVLQAVEALPEAEMAVLGEQYAAELSFLAELYEAVSEKASMPLVTTRASSWYDTSISAEYFNVISEKHYGLTSGATEATIILNNDEGTDRKEVHVFMVDSTKVDVLPGYYAFDKFDPEDTSTWKAMEVTKTAKYYEDTLGYDLVGGMNIALAYDSNAPYGFFVFEGEVLQDQTNADLKDHTGNVQTYLAIGWDGACELRSGSTPLTGNERFAVGANFGWLVKDGALVTTGVERTSSDASRSMIGIKADGTLMIVHCDGRNAPVSSGLSNYEMGELMLALGCVNAVNGDGGGSSTFISRREGEANLTMRSTPSDGSERPTINSIFIAKKSGLKPGVFDHANILSDYDYFVPAITYTFDLIAIDTTGAETTMPAGGVWSLSDDSFGTIDANGTFVSNGTLGEVTIQYTVNNTVAEKTIKIANPAEVNFTTADTVLPYGKSTPLEIEAFEDELSSADQVNHENPMYFQADSFTWTVSDEAAGTLNLEDMTYTATTDESVSGVVITATYKHDTREAMTFTITFGKGSELVPGWDFENGDVSDWLGFEAAKQWSINNDVNNSLVGSTPFDGQYNDQIAGYTFLATKSNGQVKNGNYALGLTLDYTDADFAGWSYNHLIYVGEEIVLRDVANGKNATTLGMWLYIPEGAEGMAFQSQLYVKNADGSLSCKQAHFTFKTVSGAVKNLNSCTAEDIPASRWVYASIDLTQYDYIQTPDPYDETNVRSPAIIRMYVKPPTGGKWTFYIDDVTLDYSAAVDDREQPVIGSIMYAASDESVELDGVTVTTNSLVFSASVADDTTKNNYVGLDNTTAKIYVDGVEVASQVSGGTLATTSAITLNNGVHMVTFEIADRVGNRAQKNASFTVNATDNTALVYMTGHNDSGEKPEYDSVYYVDLKTTDVSQVEVVEANIRLNTSNNWELEQMIVAPGFTAEYEMLDAGRSYISVTAKGTSTDIHSVENVVHITLTKTNDCVLTGEQTLVSLPVRVWSWDGINHTTGEVISPEAQFATGYCPIITIDVEVLYGSVENADEETETFSGSMSVETMLNDNINPWHYHDETLTVQNKEATCLEAGYTNRTYCETCQSVVDWGTEIPATGHIYEVVEDQLVCDCGVILTGNGIVSANGKLYCLIADKLVTGWQMVEDGWCYADPTTMEVVVGERTISGIAYTFDENGITEGAWYTDSNGTKYSYGPAFYTREWKEIDGATYYFGTDSYVYTGIRAIPVNRNNIKEGYKVYDFGTDGKMVNDNADYNGIISTDGDGMFYMVNGVSYYGGLMLIDGYYYYARSSGQLVCGQEYWITKNNDLLPVQYYTFGDDGKMLNPPVVEPEPDPEEPVEPEKKNGIVEEDGKLYWYVDDVKTYGGLLYLDTDGDETPDAYYYARSNGEIVCGQKYWITKNNDLLPVQYYTFGDDGKMIDPPVVEAPDPEPDPEEPVEPEKKNGIVEEDGKLYWYVDDVKTYGGLLYLDTDGDDVADAYYYARSNGEIVCGQKYWITKTNDLLPAAYYTFGDDGKMIDPPVVEEPDPEPDPDPEVPVEPEKKNGIVEEDGKLYWYVDDVKTYGGLLYLDTDGDGVADAYYYARTSGEIVCGRTYWITKTNDLLPVGGYTFGDDGKMIDPPVAE